MISGRWLRAHRKEDTRSGLGAAPRTEAVLFGQVHLQAVHPQGGTHPSESGCTLGSGGGLLEVGCTLAVGASQEVRSTLRKEGAPQAWAPPRAYFCMSTTRWGARATLARKVETWASVLSASQLWGSCQEDFNVACGPGSRAVSRSEPRDSPLTGQDRGTSP